MLNDRPAQPRHLRSFNVLATLLSVSSLVVTILTPLFTIVPIYFAINTIPESTSLDEWVSNFLAAYANHLSPPLAIFQYSVPVLATPGGSSIRFITPPSNNNAPAQQPMAMLAKPRQENANTFPLQGLIERFWWPPINAVRIAYLTLGIFAGFMGIFMLVLSGRRRHQTPKSATPEAWSYP